MKDKLRTLSVVLLIAAFLWVGLSEYPAATLFALTLMAVLALFYCWILWNIRRREKASGGPSAGRRLLLAIVRKVRELLGMLALVTWIRYADSFAIITALMTFTALIHAYNYGMHLSVVNIGILVAIFAAFCVGAIAYVIAVASMIQPNGNGNNCPRTC